MPDTKVTEQQAAEAIQQLLVEHQAQQPEATPAPVEEPAPAEPTEPVEEPTEPAAEAAPAEPAPAESDDLASLKARLAEREKQTAEAEQRYQARLQAMQQRQQESERVLRERYLRKSTAADRALKILKATRTEAGVPETEVDRVISEMESTMNPQSVSYAPPSAFQAEAAEDQAIVLNTFLNEKQMDTKEAEEFGQWIKTEGATAMHPNEQALAYRDIDGFLRIAHMRFQEAARSKETQRATAVEAVKTVQRAQKQVARAASAAPAAPRKTNVVSTPPDTIDYSKVTQEDVAKWLKQSVEQYR